MSNDGSQPSVEDVVDVFYNYIGYIENVSGLLENYKDDSLDEQKVNLERELIDTTGLVILIKQCHNMSRIQSVQSAHIGNALVISVS
jgi:hypothetical protein